MSWRDKGDLSGERQQHVTELKKGVSPFCRMNIQTGRGQPTGPVPFFHRTTGMMRRAAKERLPYQTVPPTAARVRSFEPDDRDSVLGLAPRLLIGMAPWRDPQAFLAAPRGWIEGSIDGIGPDRAVLVAEDNHGRVMGFLSVAGATHFIGERQAYVGELAVAEAAEGRGVGRVLMEAAESWAHEQQGYRVIVLETGAANDRARGFYARLGYAEEEIRLPKMLRDAGNQSG